MNPTSRSTSRVIDRTPFFYGWIILGAGAIGAVMMGASQTFTVAIFIEDWVRDLGISRSNISLIYGVATLAASLLLPVTGRLTDNQGARRMIVLVAVLLGLAYMGMARVSGILTLLGAFLAMRFLGFGSMQLVSTHVINQWFVRRRGTAMGLANQSLAMSLLLWPALAEALNNRLGWRDSWIAFGLLVWLVMIPIGWFFFRDTPERYGRRPDGDAPPSELLAGGPPVNEVNWRLAEARRTGVFWLFTLALAAMTMSMAGIVFHQVSIFQAQGLDREVAIRAFQVSALASVAGNLAVGRLLDTVSARAILAAVLLLLAGGIALLMVMHEAWQALVFAVIFGLVSGSYRVMDSTVWAKYFGRRYLGSIRGATMIGTLGGTSFGAYPLGLSYDYLGTYNPALLVLLTLPVVLVLVTFFTRRPSKQAAGKEISE